MEFTESLLWSLLIHFSDWTIMPDTLKLLKKNQKGAEIWSHWRKWEIYAGVNEIEKLIS